jgi:hypothetical protein
MASRYSVRMANVVQLKNTLAIHNETLCGRGTHSTLKKLDSERRRNAYVETDNKYCQLDYTQQNDVLNYVRHKGDLLSSTRHVPDMKSFSRLLWPKLETVKICTKSECLLCHNMFAWNGIFTSAPQKQNTETVSRMGF